MSIYYLFIIYFFLLIVGGWEGEKEKEEVKR